MGAAYGWHQDKRVKIGYVGNALAIQFAALNPSSPANAVTQTSKKILELRSLQRHLGELSDITDLRVAIKVPNATSERAMGAIRSAMIDLVQWGDDANVHVREYTDPEPVVTRILQDAA